VIVITPSGEYEVLFRKGSTEVVLDLGVPDPIRDDFPVLGERVWLIGIGAPHLVRLVPNTSREIEGWARDTLKLYPNSNVNLAICPEEGLLVNRTFEGSRGGEVRGCATGSAAAAVAYLLGDSGMTKAKVRLTSGDFLEVDVDRNSKRVSLRGPIVSEGSVQETISWDSK
jgi:diaminopimelate epimerase